MTDADTSSLLAEAARATAIAAASLVVLALIANRLAPVTGGEAPGRNWFTVGTVVGIAAWGFVFVTEALHGLRAAWIRCLERPLQISVGIGAAVALIGVISVDGGSVVQRIGYCLVTGLAAAGVWWALLSASVMASALIDKHVSNDTNQHTATP